ncbi:MAG TPA: sigma-70 family RNA polymerase sigma factor [Candidatus Aquilonibacter sp.]|nr:sigma-70 family RNA polymerase sigma factor [Candidatus Aquilonibacter sp.]
MERALYRQEMAEERNREISETVAREQARLRNFIRKRVPDREEAEDILQDVFSELVVAYSVMKPIEQAGAWLFRVARNRITDWFRKKRPVALADQTARAADGEALSFEELLPSREAGPEEEYARSVLAEELAEALDELPAEQREVFIAHEMEGRSFQELAAESGLSVNTLLSRKHYAVMHLRRLLRGVYEELS